MANRIQWRQSFRLVALVSLVCLATVAGSLWLDAHGNREGFFCYIDAALIGLIGTLSRYLSIGRPEAEEDDDIILRGLTDGKYIDKPAERRLAEIGFRAVITIWFFALALVPAVIGRFYITQACALLTAPPAAIVSDESLPCRTCAARAAAVK